MKRTGLILATLLLLLPAAIRADLPEPIKTLKHDDPVDVLAFSPDGKYLAVGNRSTISLWKLGSDKGPRQLKIPVGRFLSLSFSPDSKFLASTSTDGGVRLWAVATGDVVRTFDKDTLAGCAFSPDGKMLAVGTSDGTLKRWDPYTGAESPGVNVPAVIRSVAYSPDGKSIALGIGRLRMVPSAVMINGMPLLDATTLKPQRPFQSQAANVVFAPDGRTTIGWPDGDLICLWETATGKERGRIPGKFAAVALSPDGVLLAAVDRSENIIRIWDLAMRKEIQRLDGHDSDITSLAFSPDGKTLASGGGDFAVLLWDMTEIRKKLTTEPITLTDTDLQNRWTFLGADDAERAYLAIVSLRRSPREAIPFLQARLQGSLTDAKRLALLIADLDADEFETRERAAAELVRIGNVAEPAMRQALQRNPPLEVVRRLESLLEKLEKGALSPEQLRQVRAVEALERMGTTEAKALLEQFSRQTLTTVLTQEAQSALRRMNGK